MAIITAGVIMNLISGLGCFVYAYKMGLDEIPTKIGAVMAGAPAYVAGLRAGDEIVAMDGRRDLRHVLAVQPHRHRSDRAIHRGRERADSAI